MDLFGFSWRSSGPNSSDDWIAGQHNKNQSQSISLNILIHHRRHSVGLQPLNTALKPKARLFMALNGN